MRNGSRNWRFKRRKIHATPASRHHQTIVGNNRSGGGVLAGFQMATDTGAILGPVLVGVIIDRWGYAEGFAATGVILLLGALAWLPARETHARRPAHTSSSSS